MSPLGTESPPPSPPLEAQKPLRPKEAVDIAEMKDIKRRIYLLNSWDENEKKDRDTIIFLLRENTEKLRVLYEKYPNDNEVRRLQTMNDDLFLDYDKGEELNLDSSFGYMLTEMRYEISRAGVRIESPDQSVITDTVKRLKEIGVTPEYVLTKGNPSAPTVVFFMQIHPNPGLSDAFMEIAGVKKSQAEIYKALVGMVNGNIGNTLYAEGSDAEEEVTSKHIEEGKLAGPTAKEHGYVQAHDTLGDKLKIRGIEESRLQDQMIKMWNKPNGPLKYRATSVNIFIAQNVADAVKKSGEKVSFLTLGAAHEDGIPGRRSLMPGTSESDMLPFSAVLAYNDVNVVVIDASKAFDADKLYAYLAENPSAIGTKTKAMGTKEEVKNPTLAEIRKYKNLAILREKAEAKKANRKP